jgi:translation initiation factor IF-3
MRYKIEWHDYQVRLRGAKKFLLNGDSIKVSITLRGREIQHTATAIDLGNQFAADLYDVGAKRMEPTLRGKSVIMFLDPKTLVDV